MRSQEIAQILLNTKAVKLAVSSPFTFASGIKSPIYCDNRYLLGFPKERKIISEYFSDIPLVQNAEVLAGTSTAGISWAALISHILDKPMCYVRAEAKSHGASKTVEGATVSGKKTVIIEDLISTGGSSKKVWNNLTSEGAEVEGICAIFSYEFSEIPNVFEGIQVETLSTFSILINEALKTGYLSQDECNLALKWNADPHNWGK
ncbi:MAG: orotate phosphoribosyltransferase [Brevinema sp.]